MMRTPFDPRSYVRQLEDGTEYLDLKWRLVWLRSEQPDAQIETEMIPATSPVVCRAKVTLRTGGSATGHGRADQEADANAVEQAEDRALMRALATLGYGTEFSGDDIDEPDVPPPPVELRSARSLMEESSTSREDYQPEPPTEEPAPVDSEPRQMRSASETTDQAEASDISWTKFWEWARGRGYRNASHLNELLEVEDVRAYTPREVRRMLKKYELEHPPPGPDEE